MNMATAHQALATVGASVPANATELERGLDHCRELIARATTVKEAIVAAGMAEGLRKVAIGLDVPKRLVAEAGSLLFWAERNVGEVLGEAKEGRPKKGETLPSGKDIEATARHRYRKLAQIDEDEARVYLENATEKYMADEARINVFSPRTILRHFGLEDSDAKPTEIVKPSDNWNFSKANFDRLPGNQDDPHGYIPGDLYACALHYWTEPGDVVVAPMAGSGMILHVYANRDRWMKPEPWDLDIHCCDLNPRGPYEDKIELRDALSGLPCPADLVIADIPYFGMCKGIYSDSARDLGNMELEEYRDALLRMAAVWSQGLKPAGRAVVIASATYTDHKKRERVMIMPALIDAFAAANMTMVDIAFASRRIQQAQNPTMANMNKLARERRTMLSDMAVAMCFQRSEGLEK